MELLMKKDTKKENIDRALKERQQFEADIKDPEKLKALIEKN